MGETGGYSPSATASKWENGGSGLCRFFKSEDQPNDFR